jgi:hypothetical protein
MQPDNQLLRAFVDPTLVAGLGVEGWELLLARARMAGLTARLSYRIEDAGAFATLPARVRTQFAAARAVAGSRRGALEWEVNRLRHALTGTGLPMLLLKGAAYAMAGLPMARGRTSADIDIMVPGDLLDRVEKHLLAHGWELDELEPYDALLPPMEPELPPMHHRDRGSVLDGITILPPLPDFVLIRRYLALGRTPSRRFDGVLSGSYGLHVAVHCFRTAKSRAGSATSPISASCVGISEGTRTSGRRVWRRGARACETPVLRPALPSMLLGATVPATVAAEVERNAKPSVPARRDGPAGLPCRSDLEDRSPWWQAARQLYIVHTGCACRRYRWCCICWVRYGLPLLRGPRRNIRKQRIAAMRLA